MTPQEEQKRAREILADNLRLAWKALAANKDFQFVLRHDLVPAFALAAFSSEDGYNPHAAAQRDGQRKVLVHIDRKMRDAIKAEAEDESPRQETITVKPAVGS